MDFFFCRRFRRRWRSSTSSDAVHSYQLSEPEPPSFSNEHPEGISSSTEYAIVPESRRGSSEGISDKLRRRLSRDTRRLYATSKGTDRKSGASLFSFSSRPSGIATEPITLNDLGSSLMSARDYDSDAQFISTPRHINHNAEHPMAVGRKMTPPYLSYHGTECRDLNESTNEINTGMAIRHSLDSEERKKSGLSLRSREQARWSPQPLQGLPISHNPKINSPMAETMSPSRKAAGYADSLTGSFPEILIPKRRQRPRESTSQGHSVHLGDMNISKMLASPSISLSVISRDQSCDEKLSGSNVGIRSASEKCHGHLSPTITRIPIWDAGVLKLETLHTKETSLFYSPRTSFSSANVTRNYAAPEFNGFKEKGHDLRKAKMEYTRSPFAGFSPNSSAQSLSVHAQHLDVTVMGNYAISKADALKSRFTERFEIDPSVGSPRSGSHGDLGTNMASPRSVSIGWMSGGRRLGYGYTLVSADEEGARPSRQNTNSPTDYGSNKSSGTPVTGGMVNTHIEKQDSRTSLRTGESLVSPRISNIVDRLSLRRWSGATAFLRASSVSDSASSDSGAPSSLLGKLANRKKDQNHLPRHTEKRTLWDVGSGVDSADAIRKQSPQKKALPFIERFEEGLLERWTGLHGLRRSLSPQTRQHGETEKIRILGAPKMTTPRGQYPILQKKGANIMKFRVMSRKKWRNSSGDDVPILPIKRSNRRHGSQSMSRETEKWFTRSEILDHSAVQGLGQVNQKHMEQTGSEVITDDWASMYQDCLEFHSDPE